MHLQPLALQHRLHAIVIDMLWTGFFIDKEQLGKTCGQCVPTLAVQGTMLAAQYTIEIAVAARILPCQLHAALLLLGCKVYNAVVVHELIDGIVPLFLLLQFQHKTVGIRLMEMQRRHAALHNQAEVIIHTFASQFQRVLPLEDSRRVTRKVTALGSNNLSGIVLHVNIQQQFGTRIPDIAVSLALIDRPAPRQERHRGGCSVRIEHRARHIKCPYCVFVDKEMLIPHAIDTVRCKAIQGIIQRRGSKYGIGFRGIRNLAAIALDYLGQVRIVGIYKAEIGRCRCIIAPDTSVYKEFLIVLDGVGF